MRIAYVCADPGIPVFGRKGSGLHVQEVIRALLSCGAQVELFATRFGDDLPADLRNLPIHSLPPVPKGDTAVREKQALAANQELRSALEHEGPFNMVYERYSLWSFAGMDYARDSKSIGVLEVNAPLVEEHAQHRGLVDRASAEWVAEHDFGTASLLIAVSEEMAGYLRRYESAQGRVHVIPNGVNPARFPTGLAPTCPAQSWIFTVGFLGNLKPWHGLRDLVDAFEIVSRSDPKTRLLIVGDGNERESLESHLAGRGLLEKTHFTGRVPPSEVPGLLASMDVAVAPYPKGAMFYFSPLKIYEYMAAGLPVVASRIGQVAAVIEDGLNGMLCPPGDSNALAAAIDRLRNDVRLRTRLGTAARETVLRDHTWEKVARRILDLTHDQLTTPDLAQARS